MNHPVVSSGAETNGLPVFLQPILSRGKNIWTICPDSGTNTAMPRVAKDYERAQRWVFYWNRQDSLYWRPLS
jgi:hypothetical protein